MFYEHLPPTRHRHHGLEDFCHRHIENSNLSGIAKSSGSSYRSLVRSAVPAFTAPRETRRQAWTAFPDRTSRVDEEGQAVSVENGSV